MIPELLMPAGDLEKTKIAFLYGADACYGSTSAFSMRTREIGFDNKTLKEAIDYAHSINKKFYVTLNTYPHEFELTKIKTHARKLIMMNPDAVIVADPGVLTIVANEIKRHRKQNVNKFQKPNLKISYDSVTKNHNIEIHLSTQANSTNSESIKFWARQGISRVILARELSLKEIVEIRKVVPKKIVLEAFVHGAMCNSISGRCNLSNYLSYRDANRGACVQACRWKYALAEEKRPNQYIPLDEDNNGSYIYNSKDLNMIEHLHKLNNAGIGSFKVEGRNKSLYYCAIVARAYRKAIDILRKKSDINKLKLNELKSELETVTNRGYSTGFYFGKPTDADINYDTSRPNSDWQFVGIITQKIDINRYILPKMRGNIDHKLANRSKNIYLVEARNEIKNGSLIEIITPNKVYRKKLDKLVTFDGKILPKANPNDKFILMLKHILPTNSIIRINKKHTTNTQTSL